MAVHVSAPVEVVARASRAGALRRTPACVAPAPLRNMGALRARQSAGLRTLAPAPARSRGRAAAAAARRISASSTPRPGDDVAPGYGDTFPPPKPLRRAGVLMHPTSLPGPYGVGDLGPEAYAFVDWLAEAGMQLWQVLPLVPPDADYWSPYSGRDAHCGNPLLLSLELLAEDGLLQPSELPPVLPVGAATFVEHAAEAEPLLDLAALRLLGGSSPGAKVLQKELRVFRSEPTIALWLEDAALFAAIANSSPELKELPWWEWPEELRLRQPAALARMREERRADIDRFCAIQFLFDRQWRRLKAYANAQGVKLVGDMPIYVGGHSADVWANPQLWTLGKDGVAGAVSGTPPDAFSETGQLWGSPLYDWAAHEAEGYRWWASRLGRALALHDEVRIDHFRGLAGYWSVPGDAPTALSGCWKQGPGMSFFDGIRARLGDVPLVAEDLGVITADVVALREAIGAPGMAVLQFGWDGNPKNPHLPHNHFPNSFVYPGTHDNETMAGWFAGASPVHRANFCAYLGTDGADPAWDALRMCMMSTACTVVVAMQDVLRLGNEARMNTPGVAAGNWAWRVGPAGVFTQLTAEAEGLRRMAAQYDRLAPGAPVALPPRSEPAAAAEE